LVRHLMPPRRALRPSSDMSTVAEAAINSDAKRPPVRLEPLRGATSNVGVGIEGDRLEVRFQLRSGSSGILATSNGTQRIGTTDLYLEFVVKSIVSIQAEDVFAPELRSLNNLDFRLEGQTVVLGVDLSVTGPSSSRRHSREKLASTSGTVNLGSCATLLFYLYRGHGRQRPVQHTLTEKKGKHDTVQMHSVAVQSVMAKPVGSNTFYICIPLREAMQAVPERDSVLIKPKVANLNVKVRLLIKEVGKVVMDDCWQQQDNLDWKVNAEGFHCRIGMMRADSGRLNVKDSPYTITWKRLPGGEQPKFPTEEQLTKAVLDCLRRGRSQIKLSVLLEEICSEHGWHASKMLRKAVRNTVLQLQCGKE